MKDLEKMLMSKQGPEASDESDPRVAKAKMDVLQELLQMAQEQMGAKVKGDMDGLQKVTVAAPDAEHLAEGLDKAKEVVGSPLMKEISEDADMPVHDEDQEEEQHEKMSLPEAKDKMSFDDKPKKRKLFSMLDDE